MGHRITARIWQEGDWFVAQANEIDIASQGETEALAMANLRGAVDLFFTLIPAKAGTPEL